MTTNYVFLGSGTTDSNGVAKLDHDANGDPISHSYTGSGVGELDIVASLDDPDSISDSSLQSEPYEVIDAMYYDKALEGSGNHNDIYYMVGTSVTRGSDGSVVAKTTSDATRYLYAASSNSQSDILYFNENTCIEFDILEVTGTNQIELFCIGVGATVSILSQGHWKCVVTPNSEKIYKDDVEIVSRDYDFSSTFRATFLVVNTFKFKDLKIYPI